MKHILIIDDEPNLLSSIERNLHYFTDQFEVHTSTQSQETLDLINDLNIDLLITDILMPNKEGFEIIMEVKNKFPSVKIIAMTGGPVEYLESARLFGAHYALSKPFSKDELILAVDMLLADVDIS